MRTPITYSELLQKLTDMKACGKRRIVAIDGGCASGKTTLAAKLSEALGVSVFHMDDYFLRPEQRTNERIGEPGGNVDIERFFSEILLPLYRGKPTITYTPFSCHTMSLCEPKQVTPTSLTLVEGAYACHPSLTSFYALKVFVSCPMDIRKQWILSRNPDNAEAFFTRWMPMENLYFEYFDIQNQCDYTISLPE